MNQVVRVIEQDQGTPLSLTQGGTVFRMLPMPAYIKGPDLVFTYANPAFCDLMGLREDEIVGRRSADLDPAGSPWHEETDQQLIAEGGVTTYAADIRRADGTPLRAEVFKIRLDGPDGRIAGLVGVVVDRTQQFDAERQLFETQTIHRLVVESISDAVIMLGEDGRIVFVGPSAASMFGVAPPEAMVRGTLAGALGETLDDLLALPRDRETRGIERSVPRPDGTAIDVLIDVKPIEIGAGRWLVTCRDITERNESMRRLKASMVQTVQALCATVEQRDPYVTGHQDRVARLAVAIGRRMGLDGDRLEGLRLGAIVHDIGKINVPIQILSKPGRLTVAEFEIIRSHSEVGYQILKDVDFPWPIARMVREHHEAVDGSGYPLGLTGDQLLLESRIISVADVLEAVTSHRPYRAGLGLDRGLEILREMRGRKLDPDVVDVCIELVEADTAVMTGLSCDAAD